MRGRIKKLEHDEKGATNVEYGLIIAAIAGAILLTVISLGGKVKTAFSSVDTQSTDVVSEQHKKY